MEYNNEILYNNVIALLKISQEFPKYDIKKISKITDILDTYKSLKSS